MKQVTLFFITGALAFLASTLTRNIYLRGDVVIDSSQLLFAAGLWGSALAVGAIGVKSLLKR